MTIRRELKFTSEETKRYIEEQYTKSLESTKQKSSYSTGRRLFSRKLREFENFGKFTGQQDLNQEQEQKKVNIIIPDLPHIELEEPNIEPLNMNQFSGITQYETNSLKALRQFDKFDRSVKTISETICQFETIALECQQISDFCTSSTSASLDQIDKLNRSPNHQSEPSVFSYLISFFEKITNW